MVYYIHVIWYHSIVQSFYYIHGTITYVHGAIPLAFLVPLASSPLCPLLLTWHPPSCDRNRPPRSQVACKLTPFAPPFTQPPLQFPRTPTAPRLTRTTSGIFQFLLSGTVVIHQIILLYIHPLSISWDSPLYDIMSPCSELHYNCRLFPSNY